MHTRFRAPRSARTPRDSGEQDASGGARHCVTNPRRSAVPGWTQSRFEVRGVRVGPVGDSNWKSEYTSPGERLKEKTASSPVIAVDCWLRVPCSPRWNRCLAGLGVMASGQKGWSWHIVSFCHQFWRCPQLLSTSISKGRLTASESRKSGGIRRVWAVSQADGPT